MQKTPEVVLDTVVLVRGLLNSYGVWGRLIFDHAAQYQLVIAPALLTAYLEVIARPELTRKFKRLPGHVRDLLDLRARAETSTSAVLPGFDRDPNDAHVLANAVRGGVDYRISAGNDLLDVGEYQGIPILGAAAFLRLLDGL